MKHQKRGTATVKEKYRNVQVSPRAHAAIKAMALRLDISMGAVIARSVYERGLEDRICEP
jgi:hypothetical protein